MDGVAEVVFEAEHLVAWQAASKHVSTETEGERRERRETYPMSSP
jgi:hypothetical protein